MTLLESFDPALLCSTLSKAVNINMYLIVFKKTELCKIMIKFILIYIYHSFHCDCNNFVLIYWCAEPDEMKWVRQNVSIMINIYQMLHHLVGIQFISYPSFESSPNIILAWSGMFKSKSK